MAPALRDGTYGRNSRLWDVLRRLMRRPLTARNPGSQGRGSSWSHTLAVHIAPPALDRSEPALFHQLARSSSVTWAYGRESQASRTSASPTSGAFEEYLCRSILGTAAVHRSWGPRSIAVHLDHSEWPPEGVSRRSRWRPNDVHLCCAVHPAFSKCCRVFRFFQLPAAAPLDGSAPRSDSPARAPQWRGLSSQRSACLPVYRRVLGGFGQGRLSHLRRRCPVRPYERLECAVILLERL